jgi:heat shock protein HtpX
MIPNQLKTVILLGALTGLLLWVGNLVGGVSGLTFALIFAFVMNFAAYWWSDRLVLAVYRAKPVTESEEPELHSIVREVAQHARIPMPKVYLVNTEHANAFATGRSPKRAAVAFTRGIVELLSKDELKGVTAHELSHIKNRDTLIQSVAAMIAGVISYVAFMARFAALFGGFGGRDNDGGGIFEFLILAILTPILATIIQLAISRSREYHADATAAKTLHSGLGLAAALEKLEQSTRKKPLRAMSTTETTAHLFITNPFRGGGLVKLFSTHPPMKERVKRLRGMRF